MRGLQTIQAGHGNIQYRDVRLKRFARATASRPACASPQTSTLVSTLLEREKTLSPADNDPEKASSQIGWPYLAEMPGLPGA
jgi:hypothetical protein